MSYKCLKVKTLSNEYASLFSLAWNFLYFYFWDILSLFALVMQLFEKFCRVIERWKLLKLQRVEGYVVK